MTNKTKLHSVFENTPREDMHQLPENHAGQFCTIPHAGIIVEVEVPAGEQADSQVIRKFIEEFEQAQKKQPV